MGTTSTYDLLQKLPVFKAIFPFSIFCIKNVIVTAFQNLQDWKLSLTFLANFIISFLIATHKLSIYLFKLLFISYLCNLLLLYFCFLKKKNTSCKKKKKKKKKKS